ncbi:MAG: DUF4139 domain-containing protein [Candidatus Scalindua sp.]|nr:DUF4139 domain-containing protein [Planctomycetota bacterium]GJQ60239.1 MAG: DUF4139 domain-containing protein [Candidatus Scalindua sp.]
MMVKNCIVAATFLFLSYTIAAAENRVTESSVDDQESVEVTVYNSDLSLIKDMRHVTLPKEEGELRFMDVASHIMPETVHVKSLNYPEAFSVLEQNYEYDLMSADKLLDKYVGKKIKIVVWNKYQDRKEVVEASLLSNNNGQIFKINDEIFLGHPGIKILPEIPENLIAKPTLTWIYSNRGEKSHNLEVSYLTNNISWKADYVVVLNRNDSSADLSGWVTLHNESGATYTNATLKLIAGDVHRVKERFEERRGYMKAEMAMADAPQFKEKAFFEYHIYDLQRKTTIKDNQKKQIRLLVAVGATVKKEFLVNGNQGYFTRQYTGQNLKQSVNVYVEFKNSKDNSLGIPLPAGIMRLYKKDEEESLQFVGEDRIGHTPKDEEVKLKIGEAFDVVAERIQTDYVKRSTNLHESEWEVTVRNHKEEDITIGIIEPLFGNWEVISNSHPYKKVDAFSIRFDTDVPKDGEVKVKYRVKVGL